MAQNNDVIDLTAAAGVADEHVVSGRINQTDMSAPTLELDMNIGGVAGVVIPLPVSVIANDIYVIDGYIEVDTQELVLLMSNWTEVRIKLSMIKDNYVDTAKYNCGTKTIELLRTDGVMVPVDMACFIDGFTIEERGGVAWNNGSVYNEGDIISYYGEIYIALTTHSGSEPDTSPLDWDLQANGGVERGGVAWLLATTYEIGDSVVNAGVMYTCVIPHTSANTDLPLFSSALWSDAFIVSNVDPGAF